MILFQLIGGWLGGGAYIPPAAAVPAHNIIRSLSTGTGDSLRNSGAASTRGDMVR